jgi:hypothetical protein
MSRAALQSSLFEILFGDGADWRPVVRSTRCELMTCSAFARLSIASSRIA